MDKFFAGGVMTLIVLVVVGYVYVMTPPWVKKDLMDNAAVAVGRQVVEKSDCGQIVRVRVYKRPTFSTFPPDILFTSYKHHVVLEDGRNRTFDSYSIYRVGWTHCIFWTEYIK